MFNMELYNCQLIQFNTIAMVKLSELKINNANPRQIKDKKYKELKKSIQEFPKMLDLRPIIIDDDGTILGGNMRYRALLDLGYKEVPDSWVRKASELTDEEKRRFIIVDNVQFGEWDYEALANEWEEELLESIGLNLPKSNAKLFEEGEENFDISDDDIYELNIKVSKNWFENIHREIRRKIKEEDLSEDVIELLMYVNNYYQYCKTTKKRFSIIIDLPINYCKELMIEKTELVNEFKNYIYDRYNKRTEQK